MTDLRELLTHHTGVKVFEGRVYCHPCGELLYDPLEGFFGGPLIQRGGETIGEAAHASHLNVLLSDLLAQAWDEGARSVSECASPTGRCARNSWDCEHPNPYRHWADGGETHA